MSYFATMFPEIYGDVEEGMERYHAYQQRRKANPDNQRMSTLRRGPGEDGVQRLRGHDRFGGYFVVDCNLDENGNWQCKHEYDYNPLLKAWHTVFTLGFDLVAMDGTDLTKMDLRLTGLTPSVLVSSVNPPPRWWVVENSIEVSEAQNALADSLDRRFGSPGY
ncbi:hypothetical protein N7488_000358 [Penicillium malachiteum]|nr:hypothetical protein N7488_000358 [Penicillium malachiteum]